MRRNCNSLLKPTAVNIMKMKAPHMTRRDKTRCLLRAYKLSDSAIRIYYKTEKEYMKSF